MTILITGFEPFALRKIKLINANVSRQVLREIQSRCGDRYRYLELPVDDVAEAQFNAYVESHQPSGIVSLGESGMMWDGCVRVEPAAVDHKVSYKPCSWRAPEIPSDFARGLAGEKPTKIGLFYCNRLYVHGLHYGRRANVPVIFIHLSYVRGNLDTRTRQVLGYVAAMEHYLAARTG